MLRATISWILLISASVLFIVAACINDGLMKLLHALKRNHAARLCFLKFSQFSELLLKLWGTTVDIDAQAMNLDQKRPVLFVSSHHSSTDICLLVNLLSKFIGHRKLSFVCRRGLNHWIPSISFYARQYCYSLSGKCSKAVSTSSSRTKDDIGLPEFARRIDRNGDALVIFPEGVKPHTANEHCRTFRRKGLRMLLTNMPDAQIVPISIAGTGSFYTTPRSFKTLLHSLPRFNRRLQIQVLPLLQDVQSNDIEHTIDLLEAQIVASYDSMRSQKNNPKILKTLNHKWTL